MNLEELTKLACETMVEKRSGREPESKLGHVAIRMLGTAGKFADAMRDTPDERFRELHLVEMWPLICEAVREGKDSQLSRALEKIISSV